MTPDRLNRITIDNAPCGGPCFRGMRIRVSDVLEFLSSGATFDEVLEDYPYLENEDILAVMLDEACDQIAGALADVRLLLLLEGMELSAPFVREGQTSVLFAPQGDAPPKPSIDEMSEVFLHWPRCIDQCTDFLPHVEAAIGNAEWRKARRTGQAAFAFLRSPERLFEATHIARVLLRRAEGQGDMDSAGWAREEISWIAGGERVCAASPPREQLSLLFHLIAKSELYSCPMWPACSR